MEEVYEEASRTLRMALPDFHISDPTDASMFVRAVVLLTRCELVKTLGRIADDPLEDEGWEYITREVAKEVVYQIVKEACNE